MPIKLMTANMPEVLRSIVLGLAALLIPACASAQAGYQGSSNIQLLYGEDFDPEDIDMATLTFEHVGSYGAFEHFGFIDLFYVTSTKETGAYLEWFPKVSLGRASGRNVGAGPLSDVLLGAGVNADLSAGSDFLVWLLGSVWKFNIPGFDVFQLETYYYKQQDTDENNFEGTYQITPSWDMSLPVSEQLRFRLRGFVDFIGDSGPGEEQIVAQPQFLLDLGRLWDNPGQIYTGTEWRYWHNKGGVEGVTESVLQLELMIVF